MKVQWISHALPVVYSIPPIIESIPISSGAFLRIIAGMRDSKNAFKIYSCCLFFIRFTYTRLRLNSTSQAELETSCSSIYIESSKLRLHLAPPRRLVCVFYMA